LSGQTEVVAELPAPCEQSRIFGARQGLANKAELGGLFGHRRRCKVKVGRAVDRKYSENPTAV
jgi:hypothetical protein